MIEYIKGDLFADDHEIIAHGVNCYGVMGLGFAKILKEKYPWCYQSYKGCCEQNISNLKFLLGTVKPAIYHATPIILHCFTQLNYGRDGKKYVSYDAVDECMKSISGNMTVSDSITGKRRPSNLSISMPKIGSGLAGGDWGVIESIIKHRLKDIHVKVYEL